MIVPIIIASVIALLCVVLACINAHETFLLSDNRNGKVFAITWIVIGLAVIGLSVLPVIFAWPWWSVVIPLGIIFLLQVFGAKNKNQAAILTRLSVPFVVVLGFLLAKTVELGARGFLATVGVFIFWPLLAFLAIWLVGLALHRVGTARTLAIIGLVLALLCTVGIIVANAAGSAPKEAEEVVEPYHFFNLDLQDDEDKENDFNFGYDRYAAAEAAFKSSDSEEKDQDKFIYNWLNADFKESIQDDPALAAADMAYADAVLGTRFMSFFYDEAKENWAEAINQAKEAFMEDPELWKEYTDKFIKFLDEQAELKLLEVKECTDQMYMTPYSLIENVPDVIVMKTAQNKGHYLAYVIKIKGNTFVLRYRAECGYQPTNVANLMDIEPTEKGDPGVDPKPTPKPTPKPKPTPVDPDDPDDPDPPAPEKKNPEQAPDYKGNAEKAGVVEDGVDDKTKGPFEPRSSVNHPSENETPTIIYDKNKDKNSGNKQTEDKNVHVDNGTPPATNPLPVPDSSFGGGKIENDGGTNGKYNDENVHESIDSPF